MPTTGIKTLTEARTQSLNTLDMRRRNCHGAPPSNWKVKSGVSSAYLPDLFAHRGYSSVPMTSATRYKEGGSVCWHGQTPCTKEQRKPLRNRGATHTPHTHPTHTPRTPHTHPTHTPHTHPTHTPHTPHTPHTHTHTHAPLNLETCKALKASKPTHTQTPSIYRKPSTPNNPLQLTHTLNSYTFKPTHTNLPSNLRTLQNLHKPSKPAQTFKPTQTHHQHLFTKFA